MLTMRPFVLRTLFGFVRDPRYNDISPLDQTVLPGTRPSLMIGKVHKVVCRAMLPYTTAPKREIVEYKEL